MGFTLHGLDGLSSSFDKFIKRNEKRIIDLRKDIAREYVDALIANIPVWSGRSVRSVSVTNSTSGNATETHVDRGDTARDGRWKGHKGDFGDTRNMPMGMEPMRGAAEAIARASVESVEYDLGSNVYIVSSSYNWGDVNTATYRDDARNSAVVSEIAKAQVIAKFGKLIK